MPSWNPRHPTIPSGHPAQPQENATEPPADNNSTPPTAAGPNPFQAEDQQLQQASSASSEPPPPPYSALPPPQPVNKHLTQTITHLQRVNTHLRHALASSRTNQSSVATASENANLWRALHGRDEVLQSQLSQLNALQDELRATRRRAREMERRVRRLEGEKRGWEEEEFMRGERGRMERKVRERERLEGVRRWLGCQREREALVVEGEGEGDEEEDWNWEEVRVGESAGGEEGFGL
ncbi:uncharacterized protein LTHEOB_137 [Lasiodiplodia theobromae]|uniref:uncharacterized protein n=1 Tax=Lasiodiplodia theobromae TaxID=45133 RepID=UPI0015C3F17B|nr:uncharacterized protein LTHEOB_137 [Lasiodiplodia theobromae]KAF4543438.1 hypothetical protein LTHEOB_137 [Lasiodiplodia theobromae]